MGFLRRNLLVILFAVLIVSQLLTWRAIVELGRQLPRDPPRCSAGSPCVVEMNEFTLRQLRPQ